MPDTELGSSPALAPGTLPMHSSPSTQARFVHKMFSAHAADSPNATAVVSSRGKLSYADVNQRANMLAHHLRSIGVGPESVVALWLERSPALVISALAAWKAGAAYLPLDPATPLERLRFMVRDCDAAVVITDRGLAERARAADRPTVNFDLFSMEADRFERTDPDVPSKPDGLAYVIYTSGSTGLPKGVELTHSNLMNLVSWHVRRFQVTPEDHASSLAGLGFDASVWELWPYLASGACIHLADHDTIVDTDKLQRWLIDSKLSLSFVPTPLAERLLRMEWPKCNLRALIIGGDSLHIRPTQRTPFTVVNCYGPAECAVVATSGIVSPSSDGSVPTIGTAIDNTQVYILGDDLNPVPPGEPGELYVGGDSVGRGYRNRPDLTSERFIPLPFSHGAILYKTGDLGTFLPNGEIKFLGRTDRQVKIRGIRIELDEIASVLNTHPQVRTSVLVSLSDMDGEKRLVAFLVGEGDLTRIELQEYLKHRLPGYMIPTAFVRMEEFPLTPNGKVAIDALPMPDADNTISGGADLPATPLEQKLANIVASLLKLRSVELDADFFLLGGHSLLGTQVIARIRETFGVDIPLRTLFERPTVRDLAAKIEELLLAKVKVA